MNCTINLNQLQQISGCPDDSEEMLFIGISGFSGFSGIGLRTVDDIKDCTFSGYSGFSGVSGSGISGYSGFDADTAVSGYSGFSGSGVSGHSGNSGVVGRSGFSGYSGFSPVGVGESGYSGLGGVDGASGYSGRSGLSGDNPGISGYSGKSGYRGVDATASTTWRSMFLCAYPIVQVSPSTTTFGQLVGLSFFFLTEVRLEYIVSEDCNVENLYIVTSGTQPVSGSMVITVRKNFVNTALAITIPAGSSTTAWSNTTDIVPLSAGDTLTLQFKNNATASSIFFASAACSLFLV